MLADKNGDDAVKISICRVRILFRFELYTGTTKLSDKKIRFICRHSADVGDWTNGQLARQCDVSLRRIQQLVREYKQTGKLPSLDVKIFLMR